MDDGPVIGVGAPRAEPHNRPLDRCPFFGLDDRDRLFASPALFARKFDVTVDAEILEVIDAQMDGMTAGEITTMCIGT